MVSRTPSAAPRSEDQPSRADKAPRRQLSVDERREQLIAVALELFSSAPARGGVDRRHRRGG
ncbi:hypothetical protein ACFQ1I_11355 [Kitasatospora arboriphila]